METTLKHSIEYETADPVAIEDLLKSLDANARLLRGSGDLLMQLAPGLIIESKRVSVLYLSQQSPLKQVLALTTFLTFQKDLEAEVPALIEALTGTTIPDRYDSIVTVLAMLIAIYGISRAFEQMFPDRDKTELSKSQESLLRKAVVVTGVASHRIVAALEVLFTGRSRRIFLGASQRVFAPTRAQPRAAIRTLQGEELVSAGAVGEAQIVAGFPYEDEEEEAPKSTSEWHANVRIILHAMDRDRKRTGWAGHVPSLFDDRLPMHLEKSLQPVSLFGRSEIKGDILLTLEEDERGDLQPKEFLLVHAYL